VHAADRVTGRRAAGAIAAAYRVGRAHAPVPLILGRLRA
jgi:hypothetical protein